MLWYELLIYVIACWRITHILLRENGPFKLFRRLREALGVVYYVEHDGSESDDIAEHRFEITVCIWCASMWVGGVIALVHFFFTHAEFLFLPYALSAVAIMLDDKFGINKPE